MSKWLKGKIKKPKFEIRTFFMISIIYLFSVFLNANFRIYYVFFLSALFLPFVQTKPRLMARCMFRAFNDTSWGLYFEQVILAGWAPFTRITWKQGQKKRKKKYGNKKRRDGYLREGKVSMFTSSNKRRRMLTNAIVVYFFFCISFYYCYYSWLLVNPK